MIWSYKMKANRILPSAISARPFLSATKSTPPRWNGARVVARPLGTPFDISFPALGKPRSNLAFPSEAIFIWFSGIGITLVIFWLLR